jgi:hypothetical protein
MKKYAGSSELIEASTPLARNCRICAREIVNTRQVLDIEMLPGPQVWMLSCAHRVGAAKETRDHLQARLIRGTLRGTPDRDGPRVRYDAFGLIWFQKN